jgi:hypothetical protein
MLHHFRRFRFASDPQSNLVFDTQRIDCASDGFGYRVKLIPRRRE